MEIRKKTYKLLGLLLAGTTFYACSPTIDSPSLPAPSKGTADFTTFVAVGNSLTAGYGDGALYLEGQQNSFPLILANQFKTAGGGEFVQPLMGSGNGFGTRGTAFIGRLEAKFNPTTKRPDITPTPPSTSPLAADWRVSNATISSLGNFGVPGAKVIDALVPGYGNPANGAGRFNPFFTRFATNPATSSMISDAAARRPTFFTFGLGNNDVLGYATSGGLDSVNIEAYRPLLTQLGITSLPAGGVNGKYPVTPATIFAATYTAALRTMQAANPTNKCVIVTIPDVTRIPLFTTVAAGLAAAGVPQVAYINASGRVAALNTSDPSTGLLLLTAQTELAAGKGSPTNPLSNAVVLDPTEIKTCQDAVNAYNTFILGLRSDRVAVFDVTPFFARLVRGTTVNGVGLSSSYVTGGLFALDGVHLSPRGYAMVANEIIGTINANYGATIPLINPLDYSGTQLK